jgi:hypothetical protein
LIAGVAGTAARGTARIIVSDAARVGEIIEAIAICAVNLCGRCTVTAVTKSL